MNPIDIWEKDLSLVHQHEVPFGTYINQIQSRLQVVFCFALDIKDNVHQVVKKKFFLTCMTSKFCRNK